MEDLSVSVGRDKVSVVLRSADTLTFHSSDLDVTFVAPISSPGVSHDPVVLAVLGTPSNGGDGVVDLGTAGSTSEDTRSVQLEGGATSSKSNTEDTLFSSSLVLGDRSWGNS